LPRIARFHQSHYTRRSDAAKTRSGAQDLVE
jgi:hypothetical protein